MSVNSSRRPRVFQMRWCWVVVLMGISLGCYTQQIEKAFDDDVSAVDSNRTINDYCRSCHIHRNFSSAGHVEEKSVLYKRKVFRYATECRTCHYLEKKFTLNDFTRKTRRPQDANQGKFKEYELKILKSQKKKEKQIEKEQEKEEAKKKEEAQ